MADTERSISDLLTTLFQDGQTAGAITPHDIRDMIVSLAPSFGGMHISTAIETIVAAVDTPVKALGTTTAAGSLRNVSMPTNNRLRNDGAATRLFMVDASISITSAGNAKLVEFGIAKNGSYVTTSAAQRKMGTGADIGSLAMSFHIELAATDYVEVFVVNRTDDTNITIEFMTMNITGLLE